VLPEVRVLVTDAGGRLPWLTRAVLALGDLAAVVWPYALAGALGGAVATWSAVRRGALRAWEASLSSLPVLGVLVRDAAAARGAHVLGTLLGAGVTLDAAMPLAMDAAGPSLAPALERVHAELRGGGALGQALARTAAFPPLLVRLAATGERSGTLAAALTHGATVLEGEVARRLERLTTWIEPALVLATGGLVLLIVGAVLVPILGFDPTGSRCRARATASRCSK
jgi:general secretion pathway protein F